MRTDKRIVMWLLALGWLVGCSEVKFQKAEVPSAKNNQPVCQTNCGSGSGYKKMTIDITVPQPNDKVDIVFVIDNSYSMATEQQNLGARFSNFVSSLSGVKYKIGFVTTDMTDGRAEFLTVAGTNRNYIDHTTSLYTASQQFQNTVRVGENGSGDERGIYAAYSAYKDSSSFFRPDATLSIVILSDEDERSVGRQAGTAGFEVFESYASVDYAETLVKSIPLSRKLSIHSIVIQSGDSYCRAVQDMQRGSSAYYGTEYELASELTGGVVGSVCSSDYGSMLSVIGEVINETKESVGLGCVPVIDDANGRTFEVIGEQALIDAVVLDGDKVLFEPPLQPGDKLTINYWCRK